MVGRDADVATTRHVTALDVGERIADEIGHLPFIRGVWTHDLTDRTDVWIVTDNIQPDDELAVYGLPLHEWFSEAPVRLIVVNPRDYEPGTDLLRDVVPSSAARARRLRDL